MAHEIRFFNSMGSKVMPFTPLVPGKVSIYCCGPTVYNDPHIGNFRPVVVFDVLRRFLKAEGYDVTFVSNYTDVDDKIIKRAKELGITEKELTESVIEEYRRLVSEVGSMQPDLTPRPTVYMDQIIEYVKDLVDKGFAYQSGGDVYLRVRKIPGYGALSGNSIESLESGARIAIGEKKEDPLDFALWKETTEGIRWKSPWSEGRPGWHTECCVMINSIFKSQNGYIDIHGGGFDLKFPHHENEIAQSVAHNGNSLARFWMHNGFININNEKMSKSLGNVVLMKDVVEKYGGLSFRLMTLASYYRSPVSFSEETMHEAMTKKEQLESTFRKASICLIRNGVDPYQKGKASEPFLASLADDLNTPNALAVLYEDQKAVNATLRAKEVNAALLLQKFSVFLEELSVFGLVFPRIVLTQEDLKLLEAYDEARNAKDFALSDTLRAKLLEKKLF
ncbi:MAG TPA: cysteine--tRNA ligase [Firmicutes bacterium]|nr:cysteine--tRNA ligase [Bacillota bacterium]